MDNKILDILKNVKTICQFGIYDSEDEFVGFDDLSVVNKKVYCCKNDYKTSLDLYIRKEKNISGSNWIDHLYFRNGYSQVVLFKDFLKNKHLIMVG